MFVNKKKIAFVFIITLFITFVFADEIDDIIKNTKMNLSLDNANAVNIYTSAKMIVNPDSTSDYKIFYIKKILSYQGKKRYSDVKIFYNPDHQTVKVDTAFTINKKGDRIFIPENMIYDLDTREASWYPKYIHEKEKILNFPQIEPGYYMVLKYTVHDTKKEPVSGVEHLMESNPYAYKNFQLIFPKNYSPKYYYPKDRNVKFGSRIEGDKKILTFEVSDMPLIKEEPNKPSYMIIGCPVVYTFYKNWSELAGKKLAKLKPKNIPLAVKEKATEIIANRENEDNKFLSIYKYFAQNFSINKSYINELDFKPEDLDEIQKNKYGSIRDIVALFLAYTKTAGIDNVFPAIVLEPQNRFGSIQTSYPLLNQFSDLVVYYKGNIYLPGDEKMPFGFANVESANILYGFENPKLLKYENPTQNLEIYNYLYDFTTDKNILKANCEVSGLQNFQLRRTFMNLTPQKTKIYFNGFLNMDNATLIDGPHFENFDKIDENLKFNYTLELSDIIVKQGNYDYFSVIPDYLRYNVSKKERNYDYVIDTPLNMKMNISVQMDKKVNIIYPPRKIYYSLKMFDKKAYFKLETERNGKKLIIKCDYYIPAGLLKKEEYLKFRKFVLDIKKPLNKMIFIKH